MNFSTVLIVDDEQNVRSALQRTLIPAGYRVLEAENGEEALNVLSRHDVNLVISDMRMPGMDGADLLKKVAEQYGQVRRIVLTGYGDLPRTIVAINEGGVHRYLTKPWINEELKEVVAEELTIEKNERDEGSKIENLRTSVLELRKKVKISSNLLLGTTEILRYSSYDALTGLQQKLAESQTPFKAPLIDLVIERADRIALELQMDREQREVLRYAAMLHRIGEYALPIELISKCWLDMTNAELSEYLTYQSISASLIYPTDTELIKIISSHRPSMIGPDSSPGASTADSPLLAKILCVATEYEEMILYKGRQLGSVGIRDYMLAGLGERYDKIVVAALLRR